MQFKMNNFHNKSPLKHGKRFTFRKWIWSTNVIVKVSITIFAAIKLLPNNASCNGTHIVCLLFYKYSNNKINISRTVVNLFQQFDVLKKILISSAKTANKDAIYIWRYICFQIDPFGYVVMAGLTKCHVRMIWW